MSKMFKPYTRLLFIFSAIMQPTIVLATEYSNSTEGTRSKAAISAMTTIPSAGHRPITPDSDIKWKSATLEELISFTPLLGFSFYLKDRKIYIDKDNDYGAKENNAGDKHWPSCQISRMHKSGYEEIVLPYTSCKGIETNYKFTRADVGSQLKLDMQYVTNSTSTPGYTALPDRSLVKSFYSGEVHLPPDPKRSRWSIPTTSLIKNQTGIMEVTVIDENGHLMDNINPALRSISNCGGQVVNTRVENYGNGVYSVRFWVPSGPSTTCKISLGNLTYAGAVIIDGSILPDIDVRPN
ncbi:hypothetical protein CQT90_20555 [Salmonella enterica]|nr:hypothetical protein [Salmonella enterica]ECX8200786.1 hypothetical protein [Salmonella enterica]ELE6317851.1 hypothetical protein [Salmonella enterica]